MTPTEQALRERVIAAIRRVAPESDPSTLPGDADLREELDLDSMDFLSIVTALHHDLGVDIAEKDYSALRTLDGAVAFLSHIAPSA